MGGHGVEFDLQVGHGAAGVVAGQDTIGDGTLFRLLRGGQLGSLSGGDKGTIFIVSGRM